MKNSHRVVCAGICLGTLLLAIVAPAKSGKPKQTQGASAQKATLEVLKPRLEAIAGKLQGNTGIAVEDLNSGERFSIEGGKSFVQASSIKIAILVSLLRDDQQGKLHLGDSIAIHRADFVGGSGVLQYFNGESDSLSLHDLAVLMIVLSDNSATNYVIDRETIAHVNATMDELGYKTTRLNRRMMDAVAQREGRENLSTPDEMSALLDALHKGKLLDAGHTKMAIDILQIPKDTPLGRGLPASQPHADKPGVLPGVRTDSGIVPLAGRPYVLSVMINRAADENAAEKSIEEISRATYEYFRSLPKN
ncbi:MAG TPA: serine hydrolase [Candidatus Acidoferrales bacterium]|nr:serine hydrolase [Candidatus Acidoferrales bacterium]